MFLKTMLRPLVKRHPKQSFLLKQSPNASILDVGCGNDSSWWVKSILPFSRYTGIDVGDDWNTKPSRADRYIIVKPEEFSEEIGRLSDQFDVVISAHNLEHCNCPEATFGAMLRALKDGGQMFLSFPCEQSVSFPSRAGTLNYFDDKTHRGIPPSYNSVLKTLNEHQFKIIFAKRNYRTFPYWMIGLCQEPFSSLRGKRLTGTWQFYGFESIIIAEKSGISAHLADVFKSLR